MTIISSQLSKEARDQRQWSRATQTPHNPRQYGKTFGLRQWKKPGWDQLPKNHHEDLEEQPKMEEAQLITITHRIQISLSKPPCSCTKLTSREAVAVGQSIQPIFIAIVVEITRAWLKELNLRSFA